MAASLKNAVVYSLLLGPTSTATRLRHRSTKVPLTLTSPALSSFHPTTTFTHPRSSSIPIPTSFVSIQSTDPSHNTTNKTATEVLAEGLEAQVLQYQAGCDSSNAVLFNVTQAYNATRDEIQTSMNVATMAVGEAHADVKELLKGDKAAPEGDVLTSLNLSQEKAAHARSMENKFNALTNVKKETESTTAEACEKLKMAQEELHSFLQKNFNTAHKVWMAVRTELKAANRQLHNHLMEAKNDAADAGTAQEEGVLPGSVVTQKVLVVEKAVLAAKASKQFVAALKVRLLETETLANDAHLAFKGTNMPEYQAKLDAAKGDETPPGWSNPELTSLRQKYEEANAGANNARDLVRELRGEMEDGADGGGEAGGASGGGASGGEEAVVGGDASGAGGADEGQVGATSRFREEMTSLINNMRNELVVGGPSEEGASGAAGDGASGAAGDGAGEDASGASGASEEDASGIEDASGAASGPAENSPGPASVVTHVIKKGNKTVVTTTTFHNEEDEKGALWKKVKDIEENPCDDCEDTATGSGDGATGASGATGGASEGEVTEFNARLSSMENALMGSISEQQHKDDAAQDKEQALTSEIEGKAARVCPGTCRGTLYSHHLDVFFLLGLLSFLSLLVLLLALLSLLLSLLLSFLHSLLLSFLLSFLHSPPLSFQDCNPN